MISPALQQHLLLQRYVQARRQLAFSAGGPTPFEPHQVSEIDTGNAWIPGVNTSGVIDPINWYDSDAEAPTTFNWRTSDDVPIASWVATTHGAVDIWQTAAVPTPFDLIDLSQWQWADAGIFAFHFRIVPGEDTPVNTFIELLKDVNNARFNISCSFDNYVTNEYAIHISYETDAGTADAIWVLPNDETFYLWHYFEFVWDGGEAADADKMRLYIDGVLITPDSSTDPTGTLLIVADHHGLLYDADGIKTQWGPVYNMDGLPSAPNRTALREYLAPVNAFPETVLGYPGRAAFLPGVNYTSGFWKDWFFNDTSSNSGASLLSPPGQEPSEETAGNGEDIFTFLADVVSPYLTNSVGGMGGTATWTAAGMYSLWVQLDDDLATRDLLHHDGTNTFRLTVTAGVPIVVVEDANGVHTATYLAADVVFTDWNYLEFVFDGAGTGNAGKVKLFCNRVELTAASITGTVDTTLLLNDGQFNVCGDGLTETNYVNLGPLYLLNFIPTSGERDDLMDLNAPADA